MTNTQEHAERLKRAYAGPMSKQEVGIIRDMRAFLEFCVENGLSSQVSLGTLAHDVDGLLRQEAAFLPKVTGYTRVLDDLRAEKANPSIRAELEKDDKWD